ncbi:MAG: PspC domain-containing protein [bacterium]|nr:PspC domain-containing protein [bacterium]
MHQKKLHRSRKNRVFAGIIGGLAEYFGKDVVLLRLLAIILLVFTGFFPFGVIYILATFVIPEEPV